MTQPTIQREDGLIVPGSLLDTDLYKVILPPLSSQYQLNAVDRLCCQFTMQQAVMRHFADKEATYKFTHRDKDVFFPRESFNLFVRSVKRRL